MLHQGTKPDLIISDVMMPSTFKFLSNGTSFLESLTVSGSSGWLWFTDRLARAAFHTTYPFYLVNCKGWRRVPCRRIGELLLSSIDYNKLTWTCFSYRVQMSRYSLAFHNLY